MLLHLNGLPLQGEYHPSDSFWHRVAPPVRIGCVLMVTLGILITPLGQWLTWIVYGIGILGVIGISQVSIPMLLRRLAVEIPFVGVVLLGTLFREGGDIVWQWGWLSITTTGLLVLGSVVFKALLCLLVLNLLTLTTPVSELLNGLIILKIPPLLVAIMTSMHRYLSLLIEESNAMRRAALSRNLLGRGGWQRKVVGNLIGALFIRTYERGERVHQAMLSRGFCGVLPVAAPTPLSRLDFVTLSLTGLFVLLGQWLAWTHLD